MVDTMIRVKIKTAKELKARKISPRESYDEIITRIIKEKVGVYNEKEKRF